MSIEDLIEAAVARALGGIREEIAALRQALPPMLGTVADAARVVGCSEKSIRRGIAAGTIPHTRKGKVLRIDLAALRPPSREEVTAAASSRFSHMADEILEQLEAKPLPKPKRR